MVSLEADVCGSGQTYGSLGLFVFSHLSTTLPLLWAQALSLLCFADSVLRAFDRRFHFSRRMPTVILKMSGFAP